MSLTEHQQGRKNWFLTMVKNIILGCFFIASCTNSSCLKNREFVLRFEKVFKGSEKSDAMHNANDNAVYKEDERLRDSIFSKICTSSTNITKALFLRKVSILNSTQEGIVYLYDSNKFFSFYKAQHSSIKINEGPGN